MKIAIFHELPVGGARKAVNELAKVLKRNNVVDLYVIDKINRKEESKYFTSVKFYNFSDIDWHGGNWLNRLYKDTYELYKLQYLHQKIARIINNHHYDVVFVHPSKYTQAPFILKYLKSIKIYYCEESLRYVYEPIFKITYKLSLIKKIYELFSRYLRKQIDKTNLKNADYVFVNSKFSQKNINRIYKIKSEVFPLGVNCNFFNHVKDDKFKYDVLYIGARNEIDGYILLIDSLKYIKNTINVKIHDGSLWLSDKEILDLYRSSKIVVALAHDEPFGLIPLEAMACGIPVIAVNEGGYRETVINNHTGYIIDRDPKELAEKLSYLLKNKKRRSEMGLLAKKCIEEKWTWEISSQRMLQRFKYIIDNYSH